MEYYLKASRLKYKETECYYVIGGIYASLGKDSLAIIFLEKALMFDPTMEKARALLSDLKEENKNQNCDRI